MTLAFQCIIETMVNGNECCRVRVTGGKFGIGTRTFFTGVENSGRQVGFQLIARSYYLVVVSRRIRSYTSLVRESLTSSLNA